jgi:hypothetical protein
VPRPADYDFTPPGGTAPPGSGNRRARGQAGGGPQPGASQPQSQTTMIGLWGSPQSGKTTYLAALRHATSQGGSQYGKWNIFPENRQSAKLMADLTDELLRGRFPNPTLPGELIPLRWVFIGDLAKSRFASRRVFRRGAEPSAFTLDLIDVSGQAFDHETVGTLQGVTTDALDHLTASQGLIYLFDPVGERDNRDSSRYVNATITELKRRAAANGRPSLNLNQQLSICITKFDDPAVFQAARRHGFVNYGSDGIPQVLEKDAKDFFDLMCSDAYWRERHESGSASAQFVRNELLSVFGEANIKFYVTSSIGFYLRDGKHFDTEDFMNSRRISENRRGIRDAIRPINVLEPLVSLQQRLGGRLRSHG